MSHSDKLNRLVIGSPCTTPWDDMAGDGSRRFCEQCARQVLDLAQMTPREIDGHLQASRGKLCARMTRRHGRLVTAPTVEPPPAPLTWAQRRAAAVAATLVAAWLSARGGAAAPAPPPAATADADGGEAGRAAATRRQPAADAGAALRGRVVENGLPLPGVEVVARNSFDGREQRTVSRPDGSFSFATLAAGVYDLEGAFVGFAVEPRGGITLQPGEARQADLTAVAERTETIVSGGAFFASRSLRAVFHDSDLVGTAVAGPSTVVERHEGFVEVVTELRIESLVKGTLGERRISYRHSEYPGEEEGAAEAWAAELAPGTRVLAFLQRSEEESTFGSRPAFEAVDYAFGARQLEGAEHAAYVDRLEALARLERAAARRGEPSPADLAEWLVATAEDPLTRSEATGDLASALAELTDLAAQAETTAAAAAADLQVVVERFRGDGGVLQGELRLGLIGAFLTEGHRERLAAALAETERLDGADLALFALVRGWDEEGATRWLAKQLRAVEPTPEDLVGWWFEELASELGDERLTALTDEAMAREQEIEALWPEDESEQTARLRQERLAALFGDLRQQWAEVLASPR